MGARSAAQAEGVCAAARLGADRGGRRARRSRRRGPRPRRAAVVAQRVTRHVFFEGAAARVGGGAGLDVAGDRRTEARGPADQHGDRDPPRARPGNGRQSQGAGVRRGCRAQGRGPCGDAGPAGQVRPRPRVRHLAQRGGDRRARGGDGAGRTDAGARNPVPQICRAGDRADQRLRDDALAHRQPLRRADGAARSGRLLQMRRPVAQPDQRGAIRPQSRLAGGGAEQCRGCGRAFAGRFART